MIVPDVNLLLDAHVKGFAEHPKARRWWEDLMKPSALSLTGEPRGAEEIATGLLEAGAIVWRDPDVGVEIEAVELGLMLAAGGDVTEVQLVADVAEAANAAVSP